MAWDLFSEGESYFSCDFLNKLTDIVSTIKMINDLILPTSTFKLVLKIASYILSHYLPGCLKGIVMILSGIYYGYSTSAEVGLFSSSYQILK